ncbi:MAG: hypothetical protein OEV34_04260, partial [Gammaproteobacteria bacterium]|nr:hypothetical protein [Gammaproteobacteria bacterium]
PLAADDIREAQPLINTQMAADARMPQREFIPFIVLMPRQTLPTGVGSGVIAEIGHIQAKRTIYY